MCNPILVTAFPEWSAVRNNGRTHPAPCIRPRCVCSVLRAHYSFAGLMRRTPPPTFSDTAVTDRHSDTTIFQLRAHWVRISWSVHWKNRSDMCRRWESNLDFLRERRKPYPVRRALRKKCITASILALFLRFLFNVLMDRM